MMYGIGSIQSQTLYAHIEQTSIGGSNYYLHKTSSADGTATSLPVSAASPGRKLVGRWVYPLTGIVSIPASTWTVTYRAKTSGSASDVVAHGDIDILIRKSDNTVRATLATNVANSPSLTLVNTWQTLTGTYGWTAYTVVDQTDYLEVAYYIDVTTAQNSKSVYLRIDDNLLALADQTKIANVVFAYPNQAPVASFTFSPSEPAINDTVTFDASASYDPDGSIVSYQWDFGDGNITTVTNSVITHVYPTAASTVNYTVTLTVTDNEGSTGFVSQNVPVTNPTILAVSLPAGTYYGPDPDDMWLSQCWRLNITGLSSTFTVRINNTHASWISHDTHLIIALNNASYAYLTSLTVNSTSISSFTNSTPTPYGYTLEWENDVYPTWFNDTYVGDINPKSYKEVTVSVTFSNTTGVRMHFDAYGSRDSPPPPSSKGHVTHNAHEEDSTVLFFAPPIVQYYLTVISPYGITGGQGWYVNGSDAYATLNTGVVDHGNGTRRVFLNWSVDASGTNYTQSDPILMDGNKTAIAVWGTQYRLIMSTNFGTTNPSVGEHWYDTGSVVPISATAPSVITGERYVWNGWNGTGTISYTGTDNPSSVTMDSPINETASWTHQFYLTVTTDPTGLSPAPTPSSNWYDAGTNVTETAPSTSYKDSVEYDFNYWDVDGSSQGGDVNPISVSISAPHTATAHYAIHPIQQYYLTLLTDPPSLVPLVGEGWYANSTLVNVTAPPIVSISSDTQYRFSYWDVDGNSQGLGVNPITIHMNANHTATAHYVKQYRLLMSTNFGTTSPSVGSHWYDENSVVGISATAPSVIPGERYVWLGWTGTGTISYTGMNNPSSVTMNSPINETAAWSHEYRLTMATNFGTTSPSVGEHWYSAGTVVPIQAFAPSVVTGERYVWNGWTGTGTISYTGTANPSSVTMNSPITETASWTHQFYLTVLTDPSGLSPAPTPSSNWYDAGTPVVETAPSKSYKNSVEYDFMYWDVDGSSQGSGVNPITVTMNPAHTATAHYQVTPPPPPPPLPPPHAVGGEMILIKVDKPVVQPCRHVELTIALLTVIVSTVVLVKRKRKT